MLFLGTERYIYLILKLNSMKIRILSIICLAGILVACNTETTPKEQSTEEKEVTNELEATEDLTEETVEKVQEQNWIIYEGFIGMYQKHVVVSLALADDNSVTGTYYYDKHQKHLDLKGTYDPKSGSYELTESYKDKTTGLLRFKNFNGDLKGNWLKNAKDKSPQELELRFLYQAGNEKPTIQFSKYEMKHQITMYNGEEDELMESLDELKIAKINDQFYSFTYFLVRRNGHTGEADGVIRMDSDPTKLIGHFYGEEKCDLKFEFSGKKVDIEENNCEYYHGANAYMDGNLVMVK